MKTIRRPDHARRGAALLLVLVALAIGLLLVATWLDGRRESVPVARRVSSSTTARFAAASGVEIAIATLDAGRDWRAALEAPGFDSTLVMDDADCSFLVLDADTEAEPDDDTVRLQVTCTARADDVVSTATRVVAVSVADPVLDLGLGETAIMVERTLRIEDEAALLPWVARPGSIGGPLVVGSLDGRLDAVVVSRTAIALDTEVVEITDRDPGSETGGVRRLPDPIPSVASPRVPTPDPDDTLPGRDPIDLAGAPAGDVIASRVRVPGSARILIEEDRVVQGLGDIVIDHGAEIRVDRGTLVLDAQRDLKILGGEIVVADGARLVLRAGREMRLADAIVVPEGVDPDAANTEFPPLDGDGAEAIVATTTDADATIEIGGRSALALVIVTPEGSVFVEDDAVLHGRIIAGAVELRHRATVYALPDDGRVVGLTTPTGPHRDDDGELLDEVLKADLDSDEGLAAIASTTGMPVVTMERRAEPEVEPEAETAEERGLTLRDRIRQMIEDRRQRRARNRWASGNRQR